MEAEFLKNNMNEFKNSEQFFEQTVSAKDHHMLCVCNVTLQRVTRYLRSLALMTLRCFHLSGYSPEFVFIVIDTLEKNYIWYKALTFGK